MEPLKWWAKFRGRYQRNAAQLLFRRPCALRSRVPIISFCFDDFPRSALLEGGAILNKYGLTGTYYASFGLMGQQTPTGTIFLPNDVKTLSEQGHEWGCHTYSHCHSWDTPPALFEESIVQNGRALNLFVPGAAFKTHSYPIAWPRPRTKRRAGRRFQACRGGGQTFNAGTMDLNQLAAFFLEKSRDDLSAVQRMIDRNVRAGGWLILATHDVSDTPTPYGCTPEFFEAVVKSVTASGARILPVGEALRVVTDSQSAKIAL